ncbi:hypothetical protein J2W20_003551 [Sinomonas atrocyanea]|nr:hypothetical protein [Sinomonas atrocyanea]MDR6621510.1 hypothetical protein [Sinomonas atrocyanea]
MERSAAATGHGPACAVGTVGAPRGALRAGGL